MDKALRIFFKTGKDLDKLRLKAGEVRVSNVEGLVREFRAVLTHRAIAAEALSVQNRAEIQSTISELKRVEGQRQ